MLLCKPVVYSNMSSMWNCLCANFQRTSCIRYIIFFSPNTVTTGYRMYVVYDMRKLKIEAVFSKLNRTKPLYFLLDEQKFFV